MLIKQLSMCSSWCTNTIIISTLRKESIHWITSKCLTECFQCHQGKFCLKSQSLYLLPIHLPLTSLCDTFFLALNIFCLRFWHPAPVQLAQLLQVPFVLLYPPYPDTLSWNTTGMSRVSSYAAPLKKGKKERKNLSRRFSNSIKLTNFFISFHLQFNKKKNPWPVSIFSLQLLIQ